MESLVSQKKQTCPWKQHGKAPNTSIGRIKYVQQCANYMGKQMMAAQDRSRSLLYYEFDAADYDQWRLVNASHVRQQQHDDAATPMTLQDSVHHHHHVQKASKSDNTNVEDHPLMGDQDGSFKDTIIPVCDMAAAHCDNSENGEMLSAVGDSITVSMDRHCDDPRIDDGATVSPPSQLQRAPTPPPRPESLIFLSSSYQVDKRDLPPHIHVPCAVCDHPVAGNQISSHSMFWSHWPQPYTVLCSTCIEEHMKVLQEESQVIEDVGFMHPLLSFP